MTSNVSRVEIEWAFEPADAFEAATGHRSAFSKREGGDVVSTKPIRIIELSFGPGDDATK